MGVVISKFKNSSVKEITDMSAKGKSSRIKISGLPPILKTLSLTKKVSAMLKLNDIQTPVLQAAFQKNQLQVQQEINKLEIELDEESFHRQLLLLFWFVIHLENLELAQALVVQHKILKKLVACALQKQTDDYEYNEDQNSDDSSSRGGYDGEEWNLDGNNRGKGDRTVMEDEGSDGFQSEIFSEEEKQGLSAQHRGKGDDVHHEGGESDDEDSFFENNDSNIIQSAQQQQLPSPRRAKNLDNSANYDNSSATKLRDDLLDDENIREDAKLLQVKSSSQQADIDELKSYEGLSLGQLLGRLKQKKLAQEQEELSANPLILQQRKLGQLKGNPSTIDIQQELDANGITEDVIQNAEIADMATLLEIKLNFRSKFQNLMTNILKIALKGEEEKLSCIMVAYYEISFDFDMIVKALNHGNFQFLMFIWAFDKNYLGNRYQKDPLFITFKDLIELIKKQFNNDVIDVPNKIRQILEWKIISTDNILIALLSHHYDLLATEYMGYYSHFLDKDLFLYSVTHGNNIFLQEALVLSAFEKSLFREEDVVEKLIGILKEGYRTNFLMNILTLIDFSVWKNKHLKELIDIINDYVEENYDKNRLLLSPNPLMSITLASEMLRKIAMSRRKFENECAKIIVKLLDLGKMYSAKIDDEKFYEKLIMGVDFKDRTVIKTITQNKFEPLMDENDPKAENLMLMIWHGKEATKCDGNIKGFSNLYHILTSKAKKTSSKRKSFFKMVSNHFEPNFEVDYRYQYKYRSKAISFYFYKEFFCALAMLVIFQYINYKYLVLFSNATIAESNDSTDVNLGTTYQLLDYPTAFYSAAGSITNSTKGNYTITLGATNTTTTTSLEKIIVSIRTYVNWNNFALFFAVALLFQLLLKTMFNICSKKKIKFDKWSVMDGLCAVLFIAAVELVSQIGPASLLNAYTKSIVDYFMIIVLCVSWLRFFVYFLVVRSISKLLLTLIAMIFDTLNFMFIMVCFILIMASIFTTLYQDTNAEKFGGLLLTIRTLFGAAIGQYDYNDMGKRILSFSILQVVHVFFSNILLLNYLIAILSTTYENMKQTGIFMYKVNLYQYCERFMIAFENKSYGEIVLHPPPLSYLSIFMLPFMVSRRAMVYVTKYFSIMMFWLENVLFIFGFLGFEMCLLPFAYLKTWFNIFLNSNGVLTIILNAVMYGITGLPLNFFLVLRDCYYLLKILSFHQGCRIGRYNDLEEEFSDRATKTKIYNETRVTVISLYKRLQKHMNGDYEDDEDQTPDDFEVDPNLDFFKVEDDENMNEDFLYVVKKSLIIEEWKKNNIQNERKERIKALKQKNKTVSYVQAMMASSFKQKIGNYGLPSVRQSGNMSVKKSVKSGQHDSKGPQKIVFLDVLARNMNDESDDEGIEIDMSDYTIKPEEIKLVDEFLTMFTIVSESSMNEHLDIMLMLKALPNKITDYTLDDTEQFNFQIFQESLIAFQNVDIVNAFEYFDDKSRERAQNVKEKLVNEKMNLADIKEIVEQIKIAIDRNEISLSKQAKKSPSVMKTQEPVSQPTVVNKLDESKLSAGVQRYKQMDVQSASSNQHPQTTTAKGSTIKQGSNGQMPSFDLLSKPPMASTPVAVKSPPQGPSLREMVESKKKDKK